MKRIKRLAGEPGAAPDAGYRAVLLVALLYASAALADVYSRCGQ